MRGTVALTRRRRHGNAEVRVDPRDGADDADWLTATAWQGGGLVVDRLREVSPGVYRTTEPMPIDGEWKTMIRLHRGDALTALPVYLPADPAIPVEGVPARRDRRARVRGRAEAAPARAQDAPRAGCGASAYGVVLALALGFLALLAWGVHRVSAAPGPRRALP